MSTQTIERPGSRTAVDLEALFPGRFLSVTTFKRSGDAVSTPNPARPQRSRHRVSSPTTPTPV